MSSRERHLAQARAEHLLKSAKLTRQYDQHVAADRFIMFAKEIMEDRKVVDLEKLKTMLAELENETTSPLV